MRCWLSRMLMGVGRLQGGSSLSGLAPARTFRGSCRTRCCCSSSPNRAVLAWALGGLWATVGVAETRRSAAPSATPSDGNRGGVRCNTGVQSKPVLFIPWQHALLESSAHELTILLPAGTRPVVTSRPNSREAIVGTDRSDRDWLHNLGEARGYLYTIHAGESYVVPSTVEASLYMLLTCFITRSYTRVVWCISSCITDVPLSPEAQQITECFHMLSNNRHPDAIACRLKLMLAFECTPIALPWNFVKEIEQYCSIRMSVSAACRLSLTEECDLLLRVSDSDISDAAHNRLRFLEEVTEADSGQRLIEVDVAYSPVPQGSQHFDQSDSRKANISGMADGVAVVRYSRPCRHDNPIEVRGAAAMTLMEPWAEDPSKMSMSGSLGFLFYYELLTGSLQLPIVGSDDSHAQANTLLRIVPESKDTVLMRVLRILARDKELAKTAPQFDPASPVSQMPAFLAKVQAFLSREYMADDASQPKRYRAGDWLNHETRQDHPRNELSPETVHIDRGNVQRPVDRSSVTPEPRDFARERIELRAIDQTATGSIVGGLQPLASAPLAPLGLAALVEHTPLGRTSGVDFPWASLESHPAASSNIARGLLTRLSQDLTSFNEEFVKESALNLTGMLNSKIEVKDQLKRVRKLLGDLQSLQQQDLTFVAAAQRQCCELTSGRQCSDKRLSLSQLLAQRSGVDLTLQFEHVVALLCSSNGPAHMLSLCPGLEPSALQKVLSLTMTVMMVTNRVSHAARCEELTRSVLGLLRTLRETEAPAAAMLTKEIQLKAATLSQMLTAERQCVYPAGSGELTVDPRLLCFEYIHNLLLRKAQHGLIANFISSAKAGNSLCHQMIMGSGKTTVVSPLLCLLLANEQTLITQVAPTALLEMTRSVLRQCLAGFGLPVFTFHFTRTSEADRGLLDKLTTTRSFRGVLCTNPVRNLLTSLLLVTHLSLTVCSLLLTFTSDIYQGICSQVRGVAAPGGPERISKRERQEKAKRMEPTDTVWPERAQSAEGSDLT